MTIIKRGNTYYLRKRVPRRFSDVEARTIVQVSLKTDSQTDADEKAKRAWSQMIEGWEARLSGDDTDAERRFEAARNIAQRLGFRYLPMANVADLPREEFFRRVEAAGATIGDKKLVEAQAILGAIEQPKITVTRALDLFWDMTKDRIRGKSPDQMRRWRNPRIKAVKNFVKVVGNRPIDEINGDDMLEFMDWWMERIERKNLTPNSANKDLIHLGNILKTVNRKKRLGLVLPLDSLTLKEGEKRQRPPFSKDWIKDVILAPDALAGMNKQARCLVLGMVNTGFRPSEASSLTSSQIILNHPIPHISIEPVGRTLKSQYSRRKIPLVGVSLEAFKECPDGFPRYADNPALSSTVNKYFRANGLNQSPDHTMYSLRHSFEDRLLAADVDERIRRDLMGHRLTRERYGDGASLEQRARAIEAIAL